MAYLGVVGLLGQRAMWRSIPSRCILEDLIRAPSVDTDARRRRGPVLLRPNVVRQVCAISVSPELLRVCVIAVGDELGNATN